MNLPKKLLSYMTTFFFMSLLFTMVLPKTGMASSSEWENFKKTFLLNGQSYDRENGFTHSEGQGYSMILAFYESDPETFDEIWEWTKQNMQRSDGLISWKWKNGKIVDPNNATDADIMIAWILIEAGKKWNPKYLQEGLSLLSIIEDKTLYSPNQNTTLILPGVEGFQKKEETQINLSYWVWPALDVFVKVGNTEKWKSVITTGLNLLEKNGQGAWALSPDWTSYPTLKPVTGKSKASYDAMRIPLYLIWSGRYIPQVTQWKNFWNQTQKPWIDTKTGELATYPIQPEQTAVLNLIKRAEGNVYVRKEDIPITGISSSYYASVIILLTKTAWTTLFYQ